jgi:hypothetical protein
MIALKRLRGSPQDLVDSQALEALEQERSGTDEASPHT